MLSSKYCVTSLVELKVEIFTGSSEFVFKFEFFIEKHVLEEKRKLAADGGLSRWFTSHLCRLAGRWGRCRLVQMKSRHFFLCSFN